MVAPIIIHLDVMDGHFVPVITFGPLVGGGAQGCRCDAGYPPHDRAPGEQLAAFREAGGDILNVHVEAAQHLHRMLQRDPPARRQGRRLSEPSDAGRA